MAVSPNDPADVWPADCQKLAGMGVLGGRLAIVLGLVERCGWRWVTVACAGAMTILAFGVIASLDSFADASRSQIVLAAVLIGLLAAAGFAIAFSLVEHLGRSRTLLLDELYRRIVAEHHMRQLAATDELTGIGNRRFFTERGRETLELAKRHGQWCSVAVIDIDRFKDVNDQHGHFAGDDALVRLVTVLEANRRASDVTARLGGDEFVLLMPFTAPAAAKVAAERLRAAIRQDAGHQVGGQIGLSVSIGVASVQGGAAPLDDLLARADRALYAAKHGGRNRVMIDASSALAWSRSSTSALSIAS